MSGGARGNLGDKGSHLVLGRRRSKFSLFVCRKPRRVNHRAAPTQVAVLRASGAASGGCVRGMCDRTCGRVRGGRCNFYTATRVCARGNSVLSIRSGCALMGRKMFTVCEGMGIGRTRGRSVKCTDAVSVGVSRSSTPVSGCRCFVPTVLCGSAETVEGGTVTTCLGMRQVCMGRAHAKLPLTVVQGGKAKRALALARCGPYVRMKRRPNKKARGRVGSTLRCKTVNCAVRPSLSISFRCPYSRNPQACRPESRGKDSAG